MPATDEASSRDPDALTLTQLAKLAGVSKATVSKVVNGRAAVSPATRALVEGLIREHGYRRQRRRAGLGSVVEVVFHELAGDYPAEIIRGIGNVTREHHMAVAVSELQGRHVPGDDWIEDVLSRRPAGVIAVFSGLTDDQRERLAAREIPLVLLDPSGDLGHRVPSVGAGNWSGGLAATRHLLELGHRRIAIITGPAHALSSRARLDGYRAALDTAGVPIDPDLIRVGDYQIQDGLTHARHLMALPHPPTAIFACNDGEAIGVYHAVHELGLRVPDDVSVVGFDDLVAMRWAIPPLTTIRQPLSQMGEAAATMVLTLAKGEPLLQDRVEFATNLIVRGSTAPVKA